MMYMYIHVPIAKKKEEASLTRRSFRGTALVSVKETTRFSASEYQLLRYGHVDKKEICLPFFFLARVLFGALFFPFVGCPAMEP